MFVFFFFQAEDGIRDDLLEFRRVLFRSRVIGRALPTMCWRSSTWPSRPGRKSSGAGGSPACIPPAGRRRHGAGGAMRCRSEERRVGKECRYRGSTGHQKKKKDVQKEQSR